MLNLVTCGLIITGGIGFLVIRELLKERFRWRRLSMHTKVVLAVSGALIAAGTLLLKLTEDVTWLGAFFQSVSARTAGFSTYPLGKFTTPGLLVLIVLMFIGASPGSTGGGIKTSTYFMTVMEPAVSLRDALFEVTSAFGTVGLSTGITPGLGTGSKLLSILIMYIGRIGPLTVASLWYFNRKERISYPEGNISIG